MTTPHNRTSTAYDMSLFDTSKRKEQQTPEKKPELGNDAGIVGAANLYRLKD